MAHPRPLRARTDQLKHPKIGFTPDRTQKEVIKWGNKIDMHLRKKTMPKPVSHRTSGSPSTEWPMEVSLRLPPPLTVPPKGVKRGKKLHFVYVKRVKANTGVTSHPSAPRVRNNQCKQLEVCHLPLTATPKGGNKTFTYFCKSTEAKSNVISYFRVP